MTTMKAHYRHAYIILCFTLLVVSNWRCIKTLYFAPIKMFTHKTPITYYFLLTYMYSMCIIKNCPKFSPYLFTMWNFREYNTILNILNLKLFLNISYILFINQDTSSLVQMIKIKQKGVTSVGKTFGQFHPNFKHASK